MLVLSCFACAQAPDTTDAPTTAQAPETTSPSTDESYNTVDNSLKQALTEYIEHSSFDGGEPGLYSLATVIYYARNYGNTYFVVTDDSSYYYVCAYCDGDHSEYPCSLGCIDSYTWVKFPAEKDITETHNGAPLVNAFQINPAQQCRNIKSNDSAEFEYCQKYTPVFVDGLNIAAPLTCDECFITTKNHIPVYYISDWSEHRYETFFCTEWNGQFYYQLFVCPQDEDLAVYYSMLQAELGDYYDAVIDAIDLYIMDSQSENAILYGLLSIDSLVQIINN